MNEEQLKELYALLDMFQKKYPDRSPEEVKKTLASTLAALAEAPTMRDIDKVEQESCRLFDTGRFNDVVMAYVILSMQAAGTAREAAMNILDTLDHAFDEMSATEALERYRGSVR